MGAAAFGEENKAVNYMAFAGGWKNNSLGQFSTTFGRDNITGYCGLTFGRGNTNYGDHSIVGGAYNQNFSKGYASAIFGDRNENHGDKSLLAGKGNKNLNETGLGNILVGRNNTVNAWWGGSGAFGEENEVTNNAAFAFGAFNKAIGSNQVVFGKYNKENAQAAMLIGNGKKDGTTEVRSNSLEIYKNGTIFSGVNNNFTTDGPSINNYYGLSPLDCNFVSGSNNKLEVTFLPGEAWKQLNNCIISGNENTINCSWGNSGAFGNKNIVSANAAFALGAENEVLPNCHNSFVAGIGNKVSANGQAVVGRYNDYTHSTTLFMVGNGTGDGDRKNAFEVTKDSSVIIGDNLIIESNGDIKSDTYLTLNADGARVSMGSGEIYIETGSGLYLENVYFDNDILSKLNNIGTKLTADKLDKILKFIDSIEEVTE